MHRLPLAITWIRLPIAAAVAMVLITRHPVLVAGLLGVFVGLDVLDGVLARRINQDSAGRRALDSLIDRFSVAFCFVAATSMDTRFLPISTIYILGSIVLLPHAVDLWHSQVVLRAPSAHRLWSMAAALTGVAFSFDLLPVWILLGLFFSFVFVKATSEMLAAQRLAIDACDPPTMALARVKLESLQLIHATDLRAY